MAMGRPKAVLVLDAELREQLESLANSRSLPAGLVRRAKIILLSASGKTNVEIARQLETSKVTVSLWRCRFLKHGVSGLYEELRVLSAQCNPVRLLSSSAIRFACSAMLRVPKGMVTFRSSSGSTSSRSPFGFRVLVGTSA